MTLEELLEMLGLAEGDLATMSATEVADLRDRLFDAYQSAGEWIGLAH